MSFFIDAFGKTGLFKQQTFKNVFVRAVIVKVVSNDDRATLMTQREPGRTSTHDIDLHAIDAVLEAFVAAAQDPRTTRRELYDGFHQRMIACTDSISSAVFSKHPQGQFTMVSHTGWRELDDSTLAHVKESIKTYYAGGPAKLPVASTSVYVGKSNAVNGVEFLYVLVRRNESNELIDQVFRDLVAEIASQIETHEIRRSAARQPKTQQDLAHLVQVTQNIGKARNTTQMAMHLVNDLSKSTMADRVCFFGPSGKLLAVSGVSRVSLKTGFARNLAKLARIAISSRSPIESTENQVAVSDSRRMKPIGPLMDSLDSQIVYISPLEDDGKVYGAVGFEFFDPADDEEWVDKRHLITQSLAFVAPVVSRVIDVSSIPGIGFLDFIFNRALKRPVRVAMTGAIVFLSMMVLSYLLFVVERPFEIRAEGLIQPTTKRNIFAPRQGEIRELFVKEGSVVEPQQNLVQLESKSLRDQIIVVEGELAEANQQLQNLLVADFKNQNGLSPDEQSQDEQTQIASDIKRLKARTDSLNRRLELFRQQEDALMIQAPIRGQVTTRDVGDRLSSRPVERGDLLMTLSDLDGQWELKLDVPDNRVEFIRNSQSPTVWFRVAADSSRLYQGQVREFDFRVEKSPDETQTYSTAFVDIDELALGDNLRLGSRVIAKVDCGRRNNFFLLTYELRNKIREWFFF
jgi:multidrug efflux pump subunit AcrA (membrane-fusion protein)